MEKLPTCWKKPWNDLTSVIFFRLGNWRIALFKSGLGWKPLELKIKPLNFAVRCANMILPTLILMLWIATRCKWRCTSWIICGGKDDHVLCWKSNDSIALLSLTLTLMLVAATGSPTPFYLSLQGWLCTGGLLTLSSVTEYGCSVQKRGEYK